MDEDIEYLGRTFVAFLLVAAGSYLSYRLMGLIAAYMLGT